tara:strand:+ start:334 stop:495 length:162 start_codon:yes stop_codon:yes gene_type:complete
MYEIILKTLEEIKDSQINIQSEYAREFLANKITNAILEDNCKKNMESLPQDNP